MPDELVNNAGETFQEWVARLKAEGEDRLLEDEQFRLSHKYGRSPKEVRLWLFQKSFYSYPGILRTKYELPREPVGWEESKKYQADQADNSKHKERQEANKQKPSYRNQQAENIWNELSDSVWEDEKGNPIRHSPTEIIRWVWKNLTIVLSVIDPKEAPGREALVTLLWARKNKDEFFRNFVKLLMPSKAEMDREAELSDDGAAISQDLDRLLGILPSEDEEDADVASNLSEILRGGSEGT